MPRRLALGLAAEPLEHRDLPTVSFESLPVLPFSDPAGLDTIRAVATRGRELGRNADVFLKFGDSNTADPNYLVPLGSPGFDAATSGLTAIAPQAVDTLLAYQTPVGGGPNSFARVGPTSVPGGTILSLRPFLDGELAATNPAVALVMMGTNDFVIGDSSGFRGAYTDLIRRLADAGVVPVLSTIPDSYFNGGMNRPKVREFNQVIADVADQFRLPVWNLWRALSTLPDEGIKWDGVHLTTSPNGGGRFGPLDLQFAQNLRALQAVQILDWVRDNALSPPAAAPLPADDAWVPPAAARPVVVAAPDATQPPVVSVLDAATGETLFRFAAYAADMTRGVRVAVGDVNGDGVSDVVTAPGPGGGPHVRAFSGVDGSVLLNFFAFEPAFRGGASVAVGDADGDGRTDVVVGAGPGGGPRVSVIDPADLSVKQDFFAFDPGLRTGVEVTVGDFGRDIGPAVAAAPGRGGGPVVQLFRLTAGGAEPLTAAFAGYPDARTGLNLAAADLDGDGAAELVTGAGDGEPEVRVLAPADGWAERQRFFAGLPTERRRGVRVAVVPAGGERPAVIVTGNGIGDPAAVGVFDATGGRTLAYTPPGDGSATYGVFVGA